MCYNFLKQFNHRKEKKLINQIAQKNILFYLFKLLSSIINETNILRFAFIVILSKL